MNETDLYPIFDILERLYDENYTIVRADGRWWLVDAFRTATISGQTFRELCVNIILAGL